MSENFMVISMSRRFSCSRRGVLLAIALLALGPTLPVKALFDGPLDRLPLEARVAVREGTVYVEREADRFRGYVLVEAEPEQVWQVLTDYERFPEFLPNTVEYTVLSETSPSETAKPETSAAPAIARKAARQLQVESVTSARVLLLQVQSRDRFDISETPFDRIEFSLVSSETLNAMTGAWSLQLVESASGDRPQVLIAYEAEATPSNQFGAGAFAQIFQTQLADTLTAIRQEVSRQTS